MHRRTDMLPTVRLLQHRISSCGWRVEVSSSSRLQPCFHQQTAGDVNTAIPRPFTRTRLFYQSLDTGANGRSVTSISVPMQICSKFSRKTIIMTKKILFLWNGGENTVSCKTWADGFHRQKCNIKGDWLPSWKSTKFSNFIFFAQSIRLFLLFNMVWQPLPCDNGKFVWQGYKGEQIVERAASAVTALHSTSKLVSTNHSLFSIFGVHYQPLRP